MIESFRTVSQLDEKTAQKALQHYRKAYADHGAEQSSPYDGIIELLDRLHSAGMPDGRSHLQGGRPSDKTRTKVWN